MEEAKIEAVVITFTDGTTIRKGCREYVIQSNVPDFVSVYGIWYVGKTWFGKQKKLGQLIGVWPSTTIKSIKSIFPTIG